MKKLPDRIAALEGLASPANEWDLSSVPVFILEKIAASKFDSSIESILLDDEITALTATVKYRE